MDPVQLVNLQRLFGGFEDQWPDLALQLGSLVKDCGSYECAKQMVIGYLMACELDDIGQLFPERSS